jgi:hypothetical protein
MLLPNNKILLPLIFLLNFTVLNNFVVAATPNFFDTLNPKDKNIENILLTLDRDYERITGKSSHLLIDPLSDFLPSCYRSSCKIWADVDINLQRLFLYIDGSLIYTWKTSTGRFGYETPAMDTHPDGRIYDRHTSPKYPEGDYHGLGNMPFAFFIDGEYAIHGTTRGSWGQLGTPASHGCIRLHPDNAEMLNVLVRRNGIRNVWVTIN